MKNTPSMFVSTFVVVSALFSYHTDADAHCQVPCGIYDDHARVEALLEDVSTVEKATTMILELVSKKDAQSQNQMIRWIDNKEIHAEKIMRTIADYFMAQKIKATDANYKTLLVDHHQVMVAAMACKQNVDPKQVQKLRSAVEQIAKYWPHK